MSVPQRVPAELFHSISWRIYSMPLLRFAIRRLAFPWLLHSQHRLCSSLLYNSIAVPGHANASPIKPGNTFPRLCAANLYGTVPPPRPAQILNASPVPFMSHPSRFSAMYTVAFPCRCPANPCAAQPSPLGATSFDAMPLPGLAVRPVAFASHACVLPHSAAAALVHAMPCRSMPCRCESPHCITKPRPLLTFLFNTIHIRCIAARGLSFPPQSTPI